MRARKAPFALVPGAILLAHLWPVISGRETWFFRDLFGYHLTVKVTQARAMRDGFLPLVDPWRAAGQALVGNLNNVALYPDNLLYLVAPTTWALNAHLWLHLLIAILSMRWLARVWGFETEAAWAAGFCYGLSGFFLSQLNLYNLVAGSALAPAFAASCLIAVRPPVRALAPVVAGVLWGLLLLGGDPIVAILCVVMAAGAVLFAPRRQVSGILRLVVAMICGTLLAAPQLAELGRILGNSYRGSLGLATESRLVQSWDPRTAVELVVPLFFGAPGPRHWGAIAFRTFPPLYYSLYPGLIAIGLGLATGLPLTRASRWAWTTILAGVFLALGGWNPLMFYLYSLPGAASLRYPVKAWLLVAVGASLLVAAGFQRAVLGSAQRALLQPLLALGAIVGTGWLALVMRSDGAAARLASSVGGFLPASHAPVEVLRWRGTLLVSLLLLTIAIGLVGWSRRAPRLAGSALVSLHVVGQCVLLAPLLESDQTAHYRSPPSVLAYIEPGERVADGCTLDFACDPRMFGTYPGPESWWWTRRGWLELSPFAGVQYGVRYAFNTSPDALDGVFAYAANRVFRTLDDLAAMRLLAASSVDVVLMNREVEPAVSDLVSLRARLPSIGGHVYVYAIRRSADEVRLVRRVRGGDTRRVLREIVAPEFDPQRDAFVPGRPEAVESLTGGAVLVLEDGWERLRVRTTSEGPGMLVLGRAFLPLYSASIDGAPVKVLQVNMGQLAVEVPTGTHLVEIRVDRGPFRLALAGASLGFCGLIALAMFGHGRSTPRDLALEPAAVQGDQP